MGKRTNTAKWIESAKRWQINVQKNGKRRTFACSKPGRAGQRECNAKADEWLDNNIDGTVKLSVMYDNWLEQVKLNSGTGNHCNYESYGRIHIKPLIGNKKMENVTEQDFQNVINAGFKKGLSYKTLANIRGCMQTFLKYCRKNKVTSLVLEDIQISKKAPVKEKRILQPNDIVKLLTCIECKKYWYLNAYKFYVLTGVRRGELIALQRKDYKDNKVYINGSYNKFGELTGGKTQNAKRDFFLISVTNQIVEEQLEQIKNLDTNFLFPNKYGDRSSPNTIYNQWKRFCEEYDIGPTSLQELRHTFISLCKKVPIELLKQIVGHSKTMDTFGQYGHEVDGDKLNAKNILEKELQNITECVQ